LFVLVEFLLLRGKRFGRAEKKKPPPQNTRKKTKAHGAEVEAAGPAIQPVVVDRGEADGGRVDDGRHFLSKKSF
jgi:hypothetical protein